MVASFVSTEGCQEKHSNTIAHHPVVKPPAATSHGSVAHSNWHKMVGETTRNYPVVYRHLDDERLRKKSFVLGQRGGFTTKGSQHFGRAREHVTRPRDYSLNPLELG